MRFNRTDVMKKPLNVHWRCSESSDVTRCHECREEAQNTPASFCTRRSFLAFELFILCSLFLPPHILDQLGKCCVLNLILRAVLSRFRPLSVVVMAGCIYLVLNSMRRLVFCSSHFHSRSWVTQFFASSSDFNPFSSATILRHAVQRSVFVSSAHVQNFSFY